MNQSLRQRPKAARESRFLSLMDPTHRFGAAGLQRVAEPVAPILLEPEPNSHLVQQPGVGL
ncbi:MAG: hypothetical protein RIS79_1037 [Verrucomicrobiota bacterium]